MKLSTYLKVRIDVEDAEDFIASKLESETGAKAIVTIEPKRQEFRKPGSFFRWVNTDYAFA